MNMFNHAYDDCYGLWEVCTERDSECRGTVRLGVYQGTLDEIAFALAPKAMYSLRFRKIDPKVPPITQAVESVSVSFDIDSGTWDWPPADIRRHFMQMLKGRRVIVEEGSIHASAIIRPCNPDDMKRRAALAKLTAEERKLLGLEE